MDLDPGLYTVKVATVDGITTTHSFPIPANRTEARKLTDSVANQILEGLAGNTWTISFTNPTVVYNPQHIVRVEVAFLTADELARALKKAQAKAGFATPARVRKSGS